MISSDVVNVVLRVVMLDLKFMYTICNISNVDSLKQVMIIIDFCIQ